MCYGDQYLPLPSLLVADRKWITSPINLHMISTISLLFKCPTVFWHLPHLCSETIFLSSISKVSLISHDFFYALCSCSGFIPQTFHSSNQISATCSSTEPWGPTWGPTWGRTRSCNKNGLKQWNKVIKIEEFIVKETNIPWTITMKIRIRTRIRIRIIPLTRAAKYL